LALPKVHSYFLKNTAPLLLDCEIMSYEGKDYVLFGSKSASLQEAVELRPDRIFHIGDQLTCFKLQKYAICPN